MKRQIAGKLMVIPVVAAEEDPDTSFSGDGVQTTDFGSTGDANAVVVGPDSRITAAGSARDGDFDDDVAFACYTGDAVPPRATKVAPAAKATGVRPGKNVPATFSEAMASSSVDATTVKLFEAGTSTAPAATVVYDGATRRATPNPGTNRENGTKYRAVVTTGTKDLAGKGLDQVPTTAGDRQRARFFTVGS